jgi:hypothetical protein
LLKRFVLRPDVLAACGFGLALVCLYLRLGSATTSCLGEWISSDTLYPVNVTTDVVRDGFGLPGWRFAIAPFWFPDVVLTGVFWVVTRNPIGATLLAGFCQLGLLAGVMAFLRATIRPGDGVLHNVMFQTMAVIVTLFEATHLELHFPDLLRFYVPQSHVGSLIMTLAAVALGMAWLRNALEDRPAPAATVIVYAIVCMVGAMSNVFFFAQMLIPFTMMAGLLGSLGVIPLRHSRWPILAGWPAAISGAVLNRVLFHTTPVSAQSAISRQSLMTALDVLGRGVKTNLVSFEGLHILAVVWSAACLVIVAVTVRRVVRGYAVQSTARTTRRGAGADLANCARPALSAPDLGIEMRMLGLFCGFSLFSAIVSIGAITLGGSNALTVFKDYQWSTHYLQSVFYIPLIGLPLLLSLAVDHNASPRLTKRLALLLSLPTLVLPVLYLARTPRPRVQLVHYRPPLVKYLDRQAALRGWRYGVGGYWQARITTLLSTQNLRAYAVDGSLNPLLWVSNQYWYTQQVGDKRKAPPIDFVILDDPAWKLSREDTVRVLGEPAEEFRFEGTRILSYAGVAGTPSMASLASGAGENEPLHDFREQIAGSIQPLHVAPGGTTSLPVTVTNVSNERWVSRGRYPVSLSYRWLKGGKNAGLEGLRTLLPIPLNPGQAESVDARVSAPCVVGEYLLRMSLVQDGVAWFVLRGAKPLDIPVSVAPVRQADQHSQR